MRIMSDRITKVNYPKIERIAKNENIVTYEIHSVENSMATLGWNTEELNSTKESSKVTIPYFEDVNRAAENSRESLEKVILVTDSEPVAVKCASYLLENEPLIMANRKLDEMELKKSDPYGIYSDFQYEYETADYSLKMVKMTNGSVIKETPVNMCLKVLEGVDAEAVLYEGFESDEGIGEKVDAVLADERKRKYLWIMPKQLTASWVNTLRTEFGFALIQIHDVPNEYYEKIFSSLLQETEYGLDEDVAVWDIMNQIKKQFGNDFAEEKIEWMLEQAIHEKVQRRETDFVLKMEDFSINNHSERNALDRLNEMPGLNEMKNVVLEQTALRKEFKRNPRLKDNHSHMIFYGNPGTGKTTCARLMAEIMADYGVKNTTFVEATRNDIIGQYVGSTAKKISDLFERARGGILFVDEAGFFLNTGAGGYVTEAIKEFVRFMENCPDVMVIFAMYEKEAEAFMKLDEGLSSRISRMVDFRDYNQSELQEIFKFMVKSNGYRLEKDSINMFSDYISSRKHDKNFGNARDVRKVFESIVVQHSVRLLKSNTETEILSAEDVRSGIGCLKKTPKCKKEFGFQYSIEGPGNLAVKI